MSRAPLQTNDFLSRLRIEALLPALRSRQLRPCRGIFDRHFHILLLESGQISLQGPDLSGVLEAAAGLVLPPSPEILLTLSAGCSGWLIGLAPEMMGDVIGTRPESQLMLPSAKHWIIARDLAADGNFESFGLAQAISTEASGAAPGSTLAIAAYLRLILLALWRASPSEIIAPGHGSEQQIIEDFRREVELHYRNHLSIADYATRLGVTQSRLRRICQRNLGRSPVQLLHQRLMREAGRWLEHSGKPISEIAQALGFNDAPEFSHFFKRNAGLAPLRYREDLRLRQANPASPDPSFADWP